MEAKADVTAPVGRSDAEELALKAGADGSAARVAKAPSLAPAESCGDASRARVAADGAALAGVVPPEAALRVLGVLEGAGLEAWLVGGWVRDALRGAPCHDVDICCSGDWRESERALRAAGLGVVESGTRFGGITALVERADGSAERIEVTTYRLDGFYTDGRHPETVMRAASVEEDLARRDFTVNAMAWHPVRGLLDLYDGRGDIRRRVIRAVGEPRRRFEEDALRMLRAVRFACRLGFAMDPTTAEALAACAPQLDRVARERVGAELDGILATGRAGEALIRYPELMCAAVPELAPCRGFDQRSRYHAYDVYEHTARVVGAVELLEASRGKAAPARALIWAALLHDVGKPGTFTCDETGNGHFYGHPELGARMARAACRRLALPGDLEREVELLVRYHDRPLSAERSDLLQMLALLVGGGRDAPRLMGELLDLKRSDTLGKASGCFYYVEEIERMREMVRELVASGEAYSAATLDLRGRDLVAAGVAPGPRVGELLRRALEAAMAGEVPNRRADLLAYLDLA